MIETSVLISAAAHLAELADYLDIDGSVLITNDPYLGVTLEKGILSFASAKEKRDCKSARVDCFKNWTSKRTADCLTVRIY